MAHPKPRFPDLPPVWLAAFVALIAVLDTLFAAIAIEPGILRPIGFTIMVAGVGLIFWSGSYFYRARTPIEPGHTPKTLIATGPYRLNRNPIYTGMAVFLIGFSLATGAIWGVALAPLFCLIITKRFILGEEAMLKETFGAEADTYLAETRRW